MRPIGRQLLTLAREVHVYATMAGFAMLLLFAATGMLLNHADYFGLRSGQTQTTQATIPSNLLTPLDKSSIEHHLRRQCGVRGELDTFEDEADLVRIVFRRPGGKTEAVIAVPAGSAEITHEGGGVLAVLTDLHKGAHCGRWWWIAIDAVAVILGTSAITGLALCLASAPRRRLSLILAIIGAAMAFLAFKLIVP